MIDAPERNEEASCRPLRVKARGHLSLVEWGGETMEHAPQADASERADAVRRTGVDRLFEGGVLLLMAATALAVLASFAHL